MRVVAAPIKVAHIVVQKDTPNNWRGENRLQFIAQRSLFLAP